MIEEICQQIDRYANSEILPHMEHDDEKGIFRREIYQGLCDLGIGGITTAEEFTGGALGYLEFCQILERLARHSVPYAITISVSTMVQGLIQQFGSTEQKQRYLPALCSGKYLGAFSLSESHSGSDAANLKTTARKTSEGYILHGTKMWVTSAGEADVYLVMARTGGAGAKGISAFIIEKGTEGFSFGKAEKKMGWTTSPTRELIFENCLIPHNALIGEEGKGFSMAMGALDRGRITIGAVAIGVAQASLDYAVSYALKREQFGQPIYDFQGLQFIMAQDATEITASRLLVHKAAQDFDRQHIDPMISAMAKMKATDTAMTVTTNAVQVLGGAGYTKEYPVERYMRDAKVLQIVEGTNQIQKIIIGRELKSNVGSPL